MTQLVQYVKNFYRSSLKKKSKAKPFVATKPALDRIKFVTARMRYQAIMLRKSLG